MADDAAAAAAAAAASAAAAAATKPWFQTVPGIDETTIGHLTNQGWDKKSAGEAAVAAVKAWKEAEKFVGAPATQLLRVPKDAGDEAGWNTVWSRLGKPADAKEYNFADIKFSDGTPLEENFATMMRDTAFRLHLPKDAAAEVTRAFAKYLDAAETSENTEKQAKLVEQKAALKKNWGPNEAANMFVAQRAAAALNIAPETVSALEGVVGYDKIMEMFRQIGSKIGEDKFITSTQGGGGGAMTLEQAVARRAELMADQAWTKSYLAGDAAKKREMMALNIIITGDTGAAKRAA
jgi:hypothetical protein